MVVIGSEEEENKKNEYTNNIIKLQKEINILKSNIRKIDLNIIADCVKKNGKHEYIKEKDTGPYPESWLICKNCGYER